MLSRQSAFDFVGSSDGTWQSVTLSSFLPQRTSTTVTVLLAVAGVQPALVTVTVYVVVLVGITVIDCVVAPLLQLYPYGAAPPEGCAVSVMEAAGA